MIIIGTFVAMIIIIIIVVYLVAVYCLVRECWSVIITDVRNCRETSWRGVL